MIKIAIGIALLGVFFWLADTAASEKFSTWALYGPVNERLNIVLLKAAVFAVVCTGVVLAPVIALLLAIQGIVE